jgi:hypothetical protein
VSLFPILPSVTWNFKFWPRIAQYDSHLQDGIISNDIHDSFFFIQSLNAQRTINNKLTARRPH